MADAAVDELAVPPVHKESAPPSDRIRVEPVVSAPMMSAIESLLSRKSMLFELLLRWSGVLGLPVPRPKRPLESINNRPVPLVEMAT